MGCILYELAFGNKAFASDWAVHSYKLGDKSLIFPFDDYFSNRCKESISESVNLMLRIDSSTKPSTADILEKSEFNFGLAQIRSDLIPQMQSNLQIPVADLIGLSDIQPINKNRVQPNTIVVGVDFGNTLL